MKTVNEGTKAPDFELPDQDGNRVRLSEAVKNGPVVLFWYPIASSGGCTKEACHFRDLATEFAAEKTTRLTSLTDAETGLELSGYEIHHGQTRAGAGAHELGRGLLWRQGNVRGTYLHGLLENPAYLERFLGWAGLPAPQGLDSLDARLDAVAARVKGSLNWDFVRGLL